MFSWLYEYVSSWIPSYSSNGKPLAPPYLLDGNCKRWNGRCRCTIRYEDLLTEQARILEGTKTSSTGSIVENIVRQIINEARTLPALNEFDNLYIVDNDVGVIQLKNQRRYTLLQEQANELQTFPDPWECKLVEMKIKQPEELWPYEIQSRIVNRVYHG